MREGGREGWRERDESERGGKVARDGGGKQTNKGVNGLVCVSVIH